MPNITRHNIKDIQTQHQRHLKTTHNTQHATHKTQDTRHNIKDIQRQHYSNPPPPTHYCNHCCLHPKPLSPHPPPLPLPPSSPPRFLTRGLPSESESEEATDIEATDIEATDIEATDMRLLCGAADLPPPPPPPRTSFGTEDSDESRPDFSGTTPPTPIPPPPPPRPGLSREEVRDAFTGNWTGLNPIEAATHRIAPHARTFIHEPELK